ncbi:peptidase M20 [Desulfomarina profundi]|uniref:Peptidase M20 n=1 Tax=Desulfomarina profundi TaxID=2772557 RepID=A0A8D5FM84_9BACT|nr:peptidase M20 [Desulfomarina profundi]
MIERVGIVVEEQLKKEMANLLEELIRIPSTRTRPDEILRCSDFIERWLEENEIPFQRYTKNNVPSIVVLPPGKSSVKILLMAHFDVVEAENAALYTPRQENGRLYGRGAIDDKYGVALSLVLFRNHLKMLQENGKGVEDICFGLLFTGDEEVGGENGVGSVNEKINTDFFIALDGGNPKLIVTKEKGIVRLRLDAIGEAAHAARPWLGKNAFDILVEDYHEIKALFPEKRADHWHKTMVLTKCGAGNGSSNMVPGKAYALMDIRYTEHDDPEEIFSTIKNTVQSNVTLLEQAPLFYGGDSPYLYLLQKYSGGARLGFEHGASDARYFSEKKVPGVIWGADGEMSQHTEEEHIVLDSFHEMYDRLDRFLKEVARG